MNAGTAVRMLLTLVFGLALGACGPVLPLVASALGGGAAPTSRLAGAFAGAPSSVQNARRSGDIADEALSRINEEPLAACQAQLEPPAENAEETCRIRPTCLPGSPRPIFLRVCPKPGGTIEATKGGTGDFWSWDDGASSL
jgi:hypothetical protein